jgi:hypothetical protein
MPLGLGGGIAANYGLMARFEHEITSPGLWRDKSSSHSMKNLGLILDSLFMCLMKPLILFR